MGIDPGFVNIGVCVLHENGALAYATSFNGLLDCKGEDFYRVLSLYYKNVREFMHSRVFPALQASTPESEKETTVCAVIEQQLSTDQAVGAGIVAAVLSEVGIIPEMHNVNTVRSRLGIPICKHRNTLKARAIQFMLHCTQLQDSGVNDHVGDAYCLATYARFLVSSHLPSTIGVSWEKEPAKKVSAKKKKKTVNSKRKVRDDPEYKPKKRKIKAEKK